MLSHANSKIKSLRYFRQKEYQFLKDGKLLYWLRLWNETVISMETAGGFERERNSMIEIRYAAESDKSFWYTLDRHLPENRWALKIRDRQAYILLENGVPKGILRYNLFWDNTPFCTMLYVSPEAQRRGFGRMLMEYWEADMKKQGYGMLLTSTQVDETAQHFYRKLGYKDCGGMTVDVPGYEQPMELFLVKEIK